ncbi:MAG: hypothetical protein ACOX6T_23905 [Myxococcales bacterium]|jgi:hypothetical protein
MNRSLHIALLTSTALSLAACDLVEQADASGSCKGMVGTTSVEGELAADSEFHRDDRHFGAEAAFLNLSTASGALRIYAHLEDMPSDSDVGTHPLVPLTGFVDTWRIDSPIHAPSLTAGSFTLTSASRELIEGSFEMAFADGSKASCQFSIPRNYSLDTDD